MKNVKQSSLPAILKSVLILLFPMILSCSNVVTGPDEINPSTVNNFAPTEIGTKWEYSYYYTGPYYTTDHDSFTIRINLGSKQIRGNETLFLLNIRETGVSTKENEQKIVVASAIDSQFIDTAIVFNDSIFPAPGNRCAVFPFWKKHGISSDSLNKIIVGNDSIKAYIIVTEGLPGQAVYLQDIGLYSKYYLNISMTFSDWSIKLLSFNDKPIQKDTVINWFP
jgi:hypothetical protein